jgi:basic amino acid/polyamine antiporter, APA family
MEAPGRASPRASLTVIDGVAIMVGIVIGIGIFKTPPIVAANVGSEFAFVGVWLLGGLITLIGALCYAELAAAYPSAGGEYNFLFRAYGRSTAVLFAWARCTVIQTGAIAAVSFVFGDYAAQLIPLGAVGPAIYAAVAVVVLSGINLLGTQQSTRAQLAFTILTVVTILIVIVAGLVVSANGTGQVQTVTTAPGAGALGFAMVMVLLTYGGWNEAAYISAEVKDPGRNMVRILVGGTFVLVLIYGLMSLAYLHAFGLQGLRNTEAPAADLMRLAAGAVGATILALTVCFAALSTLNGTIFTGARVYYTLGRDLPVLQRLGRWDERGDNPTTAIVIQAVITLALVLFGATTRDGFEAMVAYTSPVFWFFMLLVGLSIFVLRWREPERARPFRVPLYPATPLLFCLTAAYLIYSSLDYAGTGAVLGVVVLVLGAPLIWLSRQREVVPAE